MKRFGVVLAGALLTGTFAIPAVAAWEPVGSVDFTYRDNHDAKLGNFRGDSIGLTARGSDVVCDSVMATFGNGRTRQLFSGELPRGQTVTVDLPGRERSVDRVDFNCRPTERWRARVDIATNDVRGYPEQERFGYDYRGPAFEYHGPSYVR
jgi:hypothetical protein